MIRVLSKRSASRDLLRGHVQTIMDLQFFSGIARNICLTSCLDDDDLLASAGNDGNIFIWKIISTSDSLQYLDNTLLT